MPTLLTRMSQLGSAFTSASQPLAVERSAETARTLASGVPSHMAAIALSTALRLRPLITTVAPQAARPRAIARPIPPVEPVTIAVLPKRSIFKSASWLLRRFQGIYCAARRRRHELGADRIGDRLSQDAIDLDLRVSVQRPPEHLVDRL